ncbi:MAG TPA: hypothetical protein VH539_07040 [Gemmatimonadaceae bacterium]|jgi:hypothetical protein
MNPLEPDAALLAKLGSIAVHAEELLSPLGHDFDRRALVALLSDAAVVAWLAAMREKALVPEKRRA